MTTNTERKPVDVLDVLKRHHTLICTHPRSNPERERADSDAINAVRELMRIAIAIDAECGNAKPDFGKVCALASEAAALARVGGV